MMAVFLIEPGVRRYDWGAASGIPELLGIEADGGPYAEAWWGAHHAAPATADAGKLDALIAADPVGMLGPEVAARWSSLPYLLKVLSIAKPVSIQVHPTQEQARQINAAHPVGESPLADDEHKPEMVIALSPMRLQSGFRPVDQVAADLRLLGLPRADQLADVITGPDGLDAYLHEVLGGADVSQVLAALVVARDAGKGSVSLAAAAHATEAHPADAGALVSLALEVIDIEPGEACFTGAGVVHSYQSGLGLEIMAASDNVLRAGLTSKPVHVPLLLDIAQLEPTASGLTEPQGAGSVQTFAPPADEFSLTVLRGAEFEAASGPRIVLALEGQVTVSANGEDQLLERGQAVFVPASDGLAVVSAVGAAAVATVP